MDNTEITEIVDQREVIALVTTTGTEIKPISTGNEGVENKSMVQEAKEAVEELKKQNQIKKELLDREDNILQRKEILRELGGNSPAGFVKKTEEQLAIDAADKLMEGTGLSPF